MVSIGGNTVCVVLSQAMLDCLLNFRRDLLRLPGSGLIALAERERLVTAIAAHDVDQAERAMLNRQRRASERYRILEDAAAKR